MSKQIISISKDYQIEADHPNYTLQSFVGGKKEWRNVGFYSSVKSAVKKFIELNPLDEKEMTLVEYADRVMASAEGMVERGIK